MTSCGKNFWQLERKSDFFLSLRRRSESGRVCSALASSGSLVVGLVDVDELDAELDDDVVVQSMVAMRNCQKHENSVKQVGLSA